MADLLLATGSVVATWLALTAVLIGVGLLVARVSGVRESASPSAVLDACWPGFAVALLLLQLQALSGPVGPWLLGALAILGALGLASERGRLAAAWARGRSVPRPVVVALVLATAWVANRAIGPGTLLDSGIYHWNAIRWAKLAGTVPGLANLQSNLGFNNAGLLWNALLDHGPWEGRSHHLVSGLFVAWTSWRGIAAAGRCLRRGSAPSPPDLAAALLLVPCLHLALSRDLPSPSTDLPAGLVLLAALHRFIVLVRGPVADRALDHELLVVTLLGTAAACMKLSAALLAGPVVIAAVVAWLVRRGPGVRLRGAVLAVLGALLLAVPWATRSVVLTGRPLHPSTIPAAGVDWVVPADRARAHAEWIAVHGRMFHRADATPDELVAEHRRDPRGWIRPWLGIVVRHEIPRLTGPFALAAAGLIGLALGSPRPPGRRRFDHATPLLVVPPVVALAAWWLTSPSPRFGWSLAWGMAVAVAAASAARWRERSGRRRVLAVVGAGLLAIAAATLEAAWAEAAARRPALQRAEGGRRWFRTLFVAPGRDHGFHPNPVLPHRVRTTRHGLAVHVPIHGSSTLGLPLPSTHVFDPDLRAREPGDLSAGFRVDPGPPAPEDEPDAGS